MVLDAQADLIDQTLGQIPLIGGAISYLNRAAVELTKQVNIIFEELASSFEGASASGASFGGNMTDYATKVLGANVRLDTFQNILRSNADAFAQLGGTVTGGAEKFLRLNRIVTHIERDGEMVARNFRGLGMTLQDVAELNADILDIQMRDFRFRDLTEREQATIIDKTIMQFATLGRLTGKRADQVAKEVKEAATRGDVAAGLAAISEQGLEQFGRASELLAPFGQNIQEAFAQLSAGIAPTGDAATALALLGDDVFQQMETLAKMVRSGVTTNEDMNKQSAILEQSLRDNAKAEEFRSIAALGSLGGIPSLAADIYSGSANLIANNISSLERFQIAADETAKALNPEDGLTKEVLNAKASLEGLGLQQMENFVNLLTNEDGLGAVIKTVMEAQTDLIQMMEEFSAKFLGIDLKDKLVAGKGSLTYKNTDAFSTPSQVADLFANENVSQIFDSEMLAAALKAGDINKKTLRNVPDANPDAYFKRHRDIVTGQNLVDIAGQGGDLRKIDTQEERDALVKLLSTNEELLKVMKAQYRKTVEGFDVNVN